MKIMSCGLCATGGAQFLAQWNNRFGATSGVLLTQIRPMFLSTRINSVCSSPKSIQRFPIAAAISVVKRAAWQVSVIDGLPGFRAEAITTPPGDTGCSSVRPPLGLVRKFTDLEAAPEIAVTVACTTHTRT
jgi:hypothetical protein